MMQSNFEKNLNMLSESVENIKNFENSKKRLKEIANMEKLQRLEDEKTTLQAIVEVKSPF